MLKNHSEPISQFVLPKNFVCQVILASHDDNGHLGMERDIRTVTGKVLLGKKWLMMCRHISILVINA